MTYKEANEKGADFIEYDWDSLVQTFSEETLKKVAESAYGRIVDGDLYHHLWFNRYLDNFTHPWYFKAHFYNLFNYEPDMDDINVLIKQQ